MRINHPLDVLRDYLQARARFCLSSILSVPFDRTVEWLTQLVSGSISVPLYTQGTWGLKSVLVLSNVEPFEYGPQKYTSPVHAHA